MVNIAIALTVLLDYETNNLGFTADGRRGTPCFLPCRA